MNRIKTSASLFLFAILSVLSCRSQVSLLNPDDPAFSKAAPAAFKVMLETTKGEILLEVKRAWSPHGVDRFYNLVRYGYYNNLPVFRIKAGTWAQFGIAGEPAIAQAWRHKPIPDDPRVESNVRVPLRMRSKTPTHAPPRSSSTCTTIAPPMIKNLLFHLPGS